MFEFLREWTKSTAVKRQETLNAYLDRELSSQDRVAFERLLVDDAVLQQELADRELIKSQLRQLPRVAVPRNFILDASKYRKPAKRPLITYYPVLRGATALTAVLFIFTLGWGMVGSGGSYNAAPAQESAMEVMVEMVEETAVEEVAMEAPAEAEMADMEAVPAERIPADGIVAAEEAPAGAIADSIEEFAEEAAGSAPAAAGAPVEIEETEEESIVDEVEADVDGETMADDVMEEAIEMMETAVISTKTAVSTPAPPSQPEPAPSPTLASTQLAQIGLFVLFITLLTLTLYAKRQR